jgi:hypothetical protein
MIRVGDKVRPRPEWRDDANRVPYGRVREVVPWGDCGVIYVEGDHRGFYAGIFEIDDYDAIADFAGSLEDCYAAVRERVAAGGKAWEPR